MYNHNGPPLKNPKCNKTLFTIIYAIIKNGKSVTIKNSRGINKVNSMLFDV